MCSSFFFFCCGYLFFAFANENEVLLVKPKNISFGRQSSIFFYFMSSFVCCLFISFDIVHLIRSCWLFSSGMWKRSRKELGRDAFSSKNGGGMASKKIVKWEISQNRVQNQTKKLKYNLLSCERMLKVRITIRIWEKKRKIIWKRFDAMKWIGCLCRIFLPSQEVEVYITCVWACIWCASNSWKVRKQNSEQCNFHHSDWIRCKFVLIFFHSCLLQVNRYFFVIWPYTVIMLFECYYNKVDWRQFICSFTHFYLRNLFGMDEYMFYVLSKKKLKFSWKYLFFNV